MNHIKEYNEFVADDMSVSVKCIGKSKDKRKIKIKKGSKEYEVYLYSRRFVMPHETKDNEELYQFLKSIVLKHVYWLFGLDLTDKEKQKEQETSQKYSDNPIVYTSEEWYKQTKEWIDFYTDDLGVFNDEERKYLYKNIGEDYYKNINIYPSSFDFREFYKLKDLKIK